MTLHSNTFIHYTNFSTLWLQLQLQLQLQLHYVTLHYANFTTLHSHKLQLQLQLHYFTLHYTRLYYSTQHYSTLHHITLHCTRYTTPQLQLQLHYTNYTALQLQPHYTTTALHHTTSTSCGWGDHCNHCNHSKIHYSNHLSVHQWIRPAISQQLTFPIVSYLWNFRQDLVRYYWYTTYHRLQNKECLFPWRVSRLASVGN